MEYNIYCDESCHLEHDDSDIMIIGSIWCEKEHIKKFNQALFSILKYIICNNK